MCMLQFFSSVFYKYQLGHFLFIIITDAVSASFISLGHYHVLWLTSKCQVLPTPWPNAFPRKFEVHVAMSMLYIRSAGKFIPTDSAHSLKNLGSKCINKPGLLSLVCKNTEESF